MSKLFELATRQELRYPSCRGPLTTEQLWKMPLQSKSVPEFSLDDVAKQINRELKETTEQSFVTPTSAANSSLELMLDVVKHIIAVKIAENAEAANAQARKTEREQLLALKADKQHEALRTLTPEQIDARLAQLSN